MNLTPFDPAEMLHTDEALYWFVVDALETKDQGYIEHAMAIVLRALSKRFESQPLSL